MLQYIKDTQYNIHNMEYVGYQTSKLKGMNVFLHKLIKVYKLFNIKIIIIIIIKKCH